MKKIKYKKLMYILIGSFVLTTTGCRENVSEEEPIINQETDDVQEDQNVDDSTDIYEENNTDNNEIVYSDDEVIQYFDNIKQTIKESDTTANAKENIINLFITITDFMFYGGEIYGITYDDLQEQTKIQLQRDYLEIDQLIENKFPNYKEIMSYKYDEVREWIDNKKQLLTDKYNDTISEDVREQINIINENDKETINSVKDITTDIYEKDKVKVKTWYENLKNNH